MKEVFYRARFLECNEYPRDYRDCIKQAIKEIIPDKELRDIYNAFGINFDEYCSDMANLYLNYKTKKWENYGKISKDLY